MKYNIYYKGKLFATKYGIGRWLNLWDRYLQKPYFAPFANYLRKEPIKKN